MIDTLMVTIALVLLVIAVGVPTFMLMGLFGKSN